MKKILVSLAVLAAGAGIGGGTAIALRTMLGPATAQAAAARPPVFVAAPHVLAPLVLPDGRLTGYVSFDAALEVPDDATASVSAKLPLLLHAINMRTYRTPLAAGPDGSLPDMASLRAVVMTAAAEAFGKGVVRRVAITRAKPS